MSCSTIGRSGRLALALVLACAGSASATPQACSLSRVSLDWNGFEGSASSFANSVSADGRYVTFCSLAALVPADNNAALNDLYLVDTTTGALELITISLSGGAGDANSNVPGSVSADGRFVAFSSGASNLVPGDTPGDSAFVRDRWLGQTTLVSLGYGGVPGSGTSAVLISGDGRVVMFTSTDALVPIDTNNQWDVYIRDLQTGTTELVSASASGGAGVGGGSGFQLCGLSADGRFATFNSAAHNLVPGDSNGTDDIFRRDRLSGSTSLVSVASNGQQGNGGSAWCECSADGRYVVFSSLASNLVPGDTNGMLDVFVRDMTAQTTERVSVSSAGAEADDISLIPRISPDGRFVTFSSDATNLVPGDTNGFADVFLHDRATGRTERVSVSDLGLESDFDSGWGAVSRDAGVITFSSGGENLVPNDSNGRWDVFARRCVLPTTYCSAKTNSAGCPTSITASGIPMASWPQGFVLSGAQIVSQQAGMLIYSSLGANSAPFGGGTMCVQRPARRTPVQNSGGSPGGIDCSGSFAFDFNAWIASGRDPSLAAGSSIWAQYWSRDPGFPAPYNLNLTDAASFVIWP